MDKDSWVKPFEEILQFWVDFRIQNEQVTLEWQEQLIQELTERVATLSTVAAQAPPGLVKVPIADQQQNLMPVQSVAPVNLEALQLPKKEWLKKRLDHIEKLENVVRKSKEPDDYLMHLKSLFNAPKTAQNCPPSDVQNAHL